MTFYKTLIFFCRCAGVTLRGVMVKRPFSIDALVGLRLCVAVSTVYAISTKLLDSVHSRLFVSGSLRIFQVTVRERHIRSRRAPRVVFPPRIR